MPREKVFSLSKADFKWSSMTAGGPGGQHQNTCNSAVRVVHEPSGAVGEARDTRSQHTNRIAALERLVKSNKFQQWARLEAARIRMDKQNIQQMIDDAVAESMRAHNIKIEVRGPDGKWVEVLEHELV
jgi:protein subunit release factor B